MLRTLSTDKFRKSETINMNFKLISLSRMARDINKHLIILIDNLIPS